MRFLKIIFGWGIVISILSVGGHAAFGFDEDSVAKYLYMLAFIVMTSFYCDIKDKK